MREWPSIVPGAPEDYYIVVNTFGRFGAAFVETDLDRPDYETTIAGLMAGQHSDPLRVVRFNTDTDRAEDASHAIRGKYCAASTSKSARCRQRRRGSSTATPVETAN